MADTEYDSKKFVKDRYGNIYKKVRKAKKIKGLPNDSMYPPFLQKTKQV